MHYSKCNDGKFIRISCDKESIRRPCGKTTLKPPKMGAKFRTPSRGLSHSTDVLRGLREALNWCTLCRETLHPSLT